MLRPPFSRARAAIAPAIVLLSLASVFGLARPARETASRSVNAISRATETTPHSVPFVGRSKLTGTLLLAPKSVRGPRIIVDAFLMGAAIAVAAALYRKRTELRLRDKYRIDATFVRRRGPPALLIVR